MDYQGLVKRLNLPIGWAAPTELTYDDIRASALARDHLRDDVRGINASLELIRRTRSSSEHPRRRPCEVAALAGFSYWSRKQAQILN